MAMMHPADLDGYNCTFSEREMYNALKEQLPDKIQVFYSVRWFEADSQDKRVDSECDFLIFDPSFGFLTVEVKGGIRIEKDGNDWLLYELNENMEESCRRLRCSPYEQAEKSMRHFYNYFKQEFNQQFHGVYGSAVAFPKYVIASQLSQEGPLELTIDKNDMPTLGKKINEIFHYWKNKRNISVPFSQEQRERFISIVNKRISLSAAAGALIPIKEKEFAKINFMQDSILDILYHYKQVRIVGGAGTGKTFIAIKKLKRNANEYSGKVLFVCCNRELKNFVQSHIEEKNIDCYIYDDLMFELIGNEYNNILSNSSDRSECFELLSSNTDIRKYDAIVVDEGQDFSIDMGLSIRYLLANERESSLYVFYDKNQNVFANETENVFALDAPPFVLTYNIRNTGHIYNYAVEHTGLGSDTIANSLIGVAPEKFSYKSKSQSLKTLTSIINRLVKRELVKTRSIVILSDKPYELSILKDELKVGAFDISFSDLNVIKDQQVCFKTVEEYKGLESDIVIYLRHIEANTPQTALQKRKEYVALTRARYYLYVLETQI